MFRNDSRASGRSVFQAASLMIPVLLLAAVVGLAQAGVWKGEEVDRDGVKHVMNPAQSIEPPTTIEMEEAWRIGGEDDEEIFGVITDIIADDEGIYLLDAQRNEIKVYSADGEYLRTIGREGEGPGEFRGAFSMLQLPGGNIGVLQAFPSKIVVLTPQGDPAGEFPLPEAPDGGPRVLFAAGYAGENLALIYGINRPSEAGFTQTRVLALVDGKGQKEIRLHSQDATVPAANALIAEEKWDVFPIRRSSSSGGRAFSAVNFGEYSINVWDSEGRLDRVIHREYPDHVRTDEEKRRVLEIYQGFTRGIPIPDITYEIEDNFNQIRALQARDDGTLWVQTSRGTHGLAEGVAAIFDVFDTDGRFTRQVTLEGQGDALNDRYFFVKDRLFVVTDFLHALMLLQGGGPTGDEADQAETEPMQIISYRLD
jgi:hypothetical protein